MGGLVAVTEKEKQHHYNDDNPQNLLVIATEAVEETHVNPPFLVYATAYARSGRCVTRGERRFSTIRAHCIGISGLPDELLVAKAYFSHPTTRWT